MDLPFPMLQIPAVLPDSEVADGELDFDTLGCSGLQQTSLGIAFKFDFWTVGHIIWRGGINLYDLFGGEIAGIAYFDTDPYRVSLSVKLHVGKLEVGVCQTKTERICHIYATGCIMAVTDIYILVVVSIIYIGNIVILAFGIEMLERLVQPRFRHIQREVLRRHVGISHRESYGQVSAGRLFTGKNRSHACAAVLPREPAEQNGISKVAPGGDIDHAAYIEHHHHFFPRAWNFSLTS